MWHNVGGGDGFVTNQDPTDPDLLYSTSQGGNMGRLRFSTGERTALRKPTWRESGYLAWSDSIAAAWPDTTQKQTTAQKKAIAAFRARQRADSVAWSLRWNWNTPYLISRHNPATLYFGANRVLKSVKHGDEMFPISPELSYADSAKLHVALRTTGGITPDVTGAETFGTVVSLNESPVRPGLLYAGTDDGRVWMTRNDGAAWEELTGRFPGLPAGSYVSRLEPSRFDTAAFYVTFDNHRRDDYTPYVYATRDGGRTFASLAATLPRGHADFVHVIREDPKNRDLLFLGTDVGAYVSLDRGATWKRFMTGLPTVPVHDLLIHERDGELIAGTHGRSIWIVDIAPLQQLTPAVRAAKAAVFAPRVAHQWGEAPVNGGNPGQGVFAAPSPAYGATLWYHVAEGAGGQARLVIQDAAGDTLRTLAGRAAPGAVGHARAAAGAAGPAALAVPAARQRGARGAGDAGAGFAGEGRRGAGADAGDDPDRRADRAASRAHDGHAGWRRRWRLRRWGRYGRVCGAPGGNHAAPQLPHGRWGGRWWPRGRGRWPRRWRWWWRWWWRRWCRHGRDDGCLWPAAGCAGGGLRRAGAVPRHGRGRPRRARRPADRADGDR
jgi:hypothetical protein